VIGLTATARLAIEAMLADPGVPANAGVRIALAEASAVSDGEVGGFHVVVATTPGAGDTVVEDRSARVFVPRDIARVFAGDLLHARVVGAQIRFSLIPLPAAAPREWRRPRVSIAAVRAAFRAARARLSR
jgi:hypothetical protein